MKKFITLLLVLTGMVSTASADEIKDFWLVGDAGLVDGLSWGAAADKFKMATTDGNIYTLTLTSKALSADATYQFKVRDKQADDWSGTAFGVDKDNNQVFKVNTAGTYTLYFVADLSEKKVSIILFNKLQFKGTFDDWGDGADMTKDATYSYSYTLDLTDAVVTEDQKFKLFVDEPGYNKDDKDNFEDGWIGNNRVQISETPTPLLVDGTNYMIPANFVKAYKKFEVTATWSLCTSILYNWTITVTPTELRSGISKAMFTNDGNYDGTIKAYVWKNADGSVNNIWPGEKIAKLNGLYTFFYPSATGYDKIIFNNKEGDSGSQTGNLDLVADKVYSTSGAISQTATVGAKGYSTYCNADYALDFTGKSIKAYTIACTDGSSLALTAKDKVAKGEPVLLYSETANDSQSIPAIANGDATATDGNKLVAGDGVAHTWTDGAKHYILYTAGENPGFYKANNNNVAVGKAYLDLTVVNASREFFSFTDDETTGIEAVNVNPESTNEIREYYNLNGQRVANPSKGLYIVNGKKVIIK